MTTFLTIAGLFIVGGMAFAFALVRMADKPAPKPPLRLVSSVPGPYESSTVHGRRVPPTTDDRGLQ
jgi:hypothetical protein